MQISDLKIGDKAKIINILPGDSTYRRKLLALGLIPNTEFTLTHIAPLGDPIEISVRGFSLSLRKAEASILQLEVIA